MDDIIKTCVGQANALLEEFGEFYPFAFIQMKDGEIRSISTYFGVEEPSINDVIQHLEKAIKGIDDDSLERAAICVDVITVPPNQQNRMNALEIRIDTRLTGSINVFVPYEILLNGGVIFEPAFKSENMSRILGA